MYSCNRGKTSYKRGCKLNPLTQSNSQGRAGPRISAFSSCFWRCVLPQRQYWNNTKSSQNSLAGWQRMTAWPCGVMCLFTKDILLCSWLQWDPTAVLQPSAQHQPARVPSVNPKATPSIRMALPGCCGSSKGTSKSPWKVSFPERWQNTWKDQYEVKSH